MNGKQSKKLRKEVRRIHVRLMSAKPKGFPRWFWRWVLSKAFKKL